MRKIRYLIPIIFLFCTSGLFAALPSEPEGLRPVNPETFESELSSKIHDAIIEKHPTVIPDEIEVRIENIEKAKEKLPENAKFYKLMIKKDSELLDRSILRIYYYDDTKNFRSQYSIFVRIRAYSNYVFTKRPILQKTIITEKDLITRKEDIYNKPKNILGNQDYIIGKEAAYTIGENNLILDWMVKTVPLIKLGEATKAQYEKNNIKIEIKGVALEEGTLGDKIRVQLKTTKKIVLGEIIATETVKVLINP